MNDPIRPDHEPQPEQEDAVLLDAFFDVTEAAANMLLHHAGAMSAADAISRRNVIERARRVRSERGAYSEPEE